MLSGLPIPASAVESIYHDGFLLNNGQLVRGDGVFLLNNDVFRWKALLSSPVKGGTQMAELEAAAGKAKKTGLLELSDEVWGLLDVVYPKPGTLFHIPRKGFVLLISPRDRLIDSRHWSSNPSLTSQQPEKDSGYGNKSRCYGYT